MKKVLKYLDFTFLRLLPTVFLMFTYYSILRDDIQALNRYESSLLDILRSNLFILLFLILGIVSIFKWFDKTIKFAKCAQYFLCIIAVSRVCINLIYDYTFYRFASNTYPPTFFGTISNFSDEVEMFALLVLAVCCLLKYKFYKTKWILAVSVTLLFFVVHSILPIYDLLYYGDTLTLKYLFNNVVIAFPIYIVSILGLAPVKQDKVEDGSRPYLK